MTPILTVLSPNRRARSAELVADLAWMLAELDHRVLLVDLDPEAELSRIFLDEDQLLLCWEREPSVRCVGEGLTLLPADPERLLGASTDSYRLPELDHLARESGAELVLVDPGPGLSPLHFMAITAATQLLVALASDVVSIPGLGAFAARLRGVPGRPPFAGYVVRQSAELTPKPARHGPRAGWSLWDVTFPPRYHLDLVADTLDAAEVRIAEDPACLAILRPFVSLVSLAGEARRPIFALRPADGALGAHARAVQLAYSDYKALVERLLTAIGGVRG